MVKVSKKERKRKELKLGDIFLIDEEPFMYCMTTPEKYDCISLETGIYWDNTINLDVGTIKEAEILIQDYMDITVEWLGQCEIEVNEV